LSQTLHSEIYSIVKSRYWSLGALGPEAGLSGRASSKALVVFLIYRAARARVGVGLGQDVVVFVLGPMNSLLKDGFGLVELELGLEVLQVVGVATAVGTTAGVGPVELLINNLLASASPIAFASAILLGFLRIDTLKAVLAKELGDDFLRSDSTFGNASVVLVGELVRSSHFDGV
jgi:hypothetical protein